MSKDRRPVSDAVLEARRRRPGRPGGRPQAGRPELVPVAARVPIPGTAERRHPPRTGARSEPAAHRSQQQHRPRVGPVLALVVRGQLRPPHAGRAPARPARRRGADRPRRGGPRFPPRARGVEGTVDAALADVDGGEPRDDGVEAPGAVRGVRRGACLADRIPRGVGTRLALGSSGRCSRLGAGAARLPRGVRLRPSLAAHRAGAAADHLADDPRLGRPRRCLAARFREGRVEQGARPGPSSRPPLLPPCAPGHRF